MGVPMSANLTFRYSHVQSENQNFMIDICRQALLVNKHLANNRFHCIDRHLFCGLQMSQLTY